MQSVLKSVEKKLRNGEHETWAGPNGTLWKWNLEWENGDKGESRTKSPEHKYVIGNTYTYNSSTNAGGYVSFTDIKDINAKPFVPGQGKRGPSYWDKPEVVRSVTKNICLQLVVEFFNSLSIDKKIARTYEDVWKYSDLLYDWIYFGIKEDVNTPNWSDPIIRRREAVKLAIEIAKHKFPKMEVQNFKNLLEEHATKILEYMNSTHNIHTQNE